MIISSSSSRNQCVSERVLLLYAEKHFSTTTTYQLPMPACLEISIFTLIIAL